MFHLPRKSTAPSSIHFFSFENGDIGLNSGKSSILILKQTNRHLSSVSITLLSLSQSAKSLNTREREVSVKNYKIYQFYSTTSFFLVMLRVIWDYVRIAVSQSDATVKKNKKIGAHPHYSSQSTQHHPAMQFGNEKKWSFLSQFKFHHSPPWKLKI